MFDLKIVNVILVLSVALFVSSAAAELEVEYVVPVDSENAELIREKRDAEPRRHHHHHLILSKPQYTENYRPSGYQEYHHSGGSGNVATFAQSSAGAISANNGHGHGGNAASQSSSHSASYSFGPFSASFSASQSNANSGGFFDY